MIRNCSPGLPACELTSSGVRIPAQDEYRSTRRAQQRPQGKHFAPVICMAIGMRDREAHVRRDARSRSTPRTREPWLVSQTGNIWGRQEMSALRLFTMERISTWIEQSMSRIWSRESKDRSGDLPPIHVTVGYGANR